MVLFSIKNAHLRQGNFNLRVDQLELQPGRLYALVGPNGAGKSTLLQYLAALEMPTDGIFCFNGEVLSGSVRQQREWRRHVTLVHQSPYFFRGTVRENLELGLKTRGVGRTARRQRISDLLQQLGLEGYDEREARTLSRGELQRAALARALLLEPKLLLLDEPTANLDADGLEILEPLLQQVTEAGTCVVFSSHDPMQPKRLGAYVVVLREGALLAPVVADKERRKT
mgnify:CR=1 FL=1